MEKARNSTQILVTTAIQLRFLYICDEFLIIGPFIKQGDHQRQSFILTMLVSSIKITLQPSGETVKEIPKLGIDCVFMLNITFSTLVGMYKRPQLHYSSVPYIIIV